MRKKLLKTVSFFFIKVLTFCWHKDSLIEEDSFVSFVDKFFDADVTVSISSAFEPINIIFVPFFIPHSSKDLLSTRIPKL